MNSNLRSCKHFFFSTNLPHSKKLVLELHRVLCWDHFLHYTYHLLGNIIRKLCLLFNYYVDDTWLFLSIKSDNGNQLVKPHACLRDIKAWMTYTFSFHSVNMVSNLLWMASTLFWPPVTL